jgi:L-amino acid N-acyltransferase YncA
MRSMSFPEPTIRPAEEGDAPAIAAIYAPYVLETAITFESEPPTPEIMAQRIVGTLETHPWLVANCDDETIGYAYAGKHRERSAYRWSADVTIYVNSARRCSGIGRALYRPLLAILRRQGFRSAFAEIVLPNPASVRLHEAAGFKSIGIYNDIGFKLGRWHDIGYWRLGLAEGTEPPEEPVPFATFRKTLACASIIQTRAGRAVP